MNRYQDITIKALLIFAVAIVTTSLFPLFTVIITFTSALALFYIFGTEDALTVAVVTFSIEILLITLILKRKNLWKRIPKHIYIGFGLGIALIVYLLSSQY